MSEKKTDISSKDNTVEGGHQLGYINVKRAKVQAMEADIKLHLISMEKETNIKYTCIVCTVVLQFRLCADIHLHAEHVVQALVELSIISGLNAMLGSVPCEHMEVYDITGHQNNQ